MFKNLLPAALALCLLGCTLAAQARSEAITVGQVAPLKNPASVGNQVRMGIELYFEVVNRSGGVGGVPLRLVTRHREDASDSAAKTRELLREAKPLALIGLMGTGPMEALLQQGVLVEAAVPVVGIRTGAIALHTPPHPWLFHTRAHYGAEVRKIVDHLVPIGFKRFAVFYENTAFGLEGQQHALAALAEARQAPPVMIGFAKDGSNLQSMAQALVRAEPDAVIAVGETAAVAEFHRIVRATGARPQVVTLSAVDAAQVVRAIGPQQAQGLGITQVVPDPLSRRHPLVREFQDNARRLRPPDFELTQAGLEGYIAAKVLVEGVRRCPANPTPAQLRAALEGMGRLELGGINVEFGPRRRTGTSYVDIGIIGANGRLLQ